MSEESKYVEISRSKDGRKAMLIETWETNERNSANNSWKKASRTHHVYIVNGDYRFKN